MTRLLASVLFLVGLTGSHFATDATAPCPSICECISVEKAHCDFPTGLQNLSLYPSLSAFNWLYLSHNSIRSLDDADFSSLGNTTILSLDSNEISAIPAGIFSGLDNLLILMLDHNRIVNISAGAFSHIEHLETLHLSYNNIQFIHDRAFENMTNLMQLNLDHNEIEDIEGKFASLTGLYSLSLGLNLLQYLETKSFQNLVTLGYLDLFANNISFISKDAFSDLQNLKSLKLWGNPMMSMEWITSPSNAGSLSQLTHLDVRICGLSTIPQDIFHILPVLASFYLGGNPWRCDASLLFLRDEMRKNTDRFPDHYSAFCAYPARLDGQMVRKFLNTDPNARAQTVDRHSTSQRRHRLRSEETKDNNTSPIRSIATRRHHAGKNKPSHAKTTVSSSSQRDAKSILAGKSHRSKNHTKHQSKSHVPTEHHSKSGHARKSHHSGKHRKHESRGHHASTEHHSKPGLARKSHHAKHQKHHKNSKHKSSERGKHHRNEKHGHSADLVMNDATVKPKVKDNSKPADGKESSSSVTLGLLVFSVVVIIGLVVGILARKYRRRVPCLARGLNTHSREKFPIVRGQTAGKRRSRGMSESTSSNESISRPRPPSLANGVVNDRENGFCGTVHDVTDTAALTMNMECLEHDSDATEL